MLAYKFPKEERVLGPQQVETKFDQDSYLSAQLSLWNQRGSNVIGGNVLAIPIDNALLYVEPKYLQAEAATYPELRLVVVHNDNLSYAETFDDALRGLYAEDGAAKPSAIIPEIGDPKLPFKYPDTQANQAFQRCLRLQGEGRFVETGKELEKLRRAQEQLSQRRAN